ncbi:flagellar type III secretion system pore protein FliP [Sphingopyxis indica]|uniref:flagellar type III secretion system pore protein FliP n=1 Tax=Sphingopyxis indica TaxID=436663 RepID=UPI003744587B
MAPRLRSGIRVKGNGLSPRPHLLRAAALAGGLALLAAAPAAHAQAADGLARAVNEIGGDGRPLSLSLQILLLMSLLTVLPSLLLMMTSFTRIIIVLSILRHALGLQQTPPNQVLVGLSLFLSLFVMQPVISEVNRVAITPYSQEQIDIGEAVVRSGTSVHGFMMAQTRKTDLMMFAKIAKAPDYASPRDVPFSILLPAFVTSELKTAFQIGFLIFLPFLVIDLIVASALMSLGMMMLSPTVISMPFKLLLFVLVDGWALTMGSLASSFGT